MGAEQGKEIAKIKLPKIVCVCCESTYESRDHTDTKEDDTKSLGETEGERTEN